MKKLIAIVFLFTFIFSVGAAFAAKVTPIPAPGVKIWSDGATDEYGKYSWVDNGNRYRLIYNASDACVYAGEPVFYIFSTGNDYSVTRFGTTGSYEAMAGIVYCDTTGNDSITKEGYGWIQDNGLASAWVSGEGTNIFMGTVLQGALINNDGRGGRYLKVDRPLTAGSQWGSSEATARALFNYAGTSVVTRQAVSLRAR